MGALRTPITSQVVCLVEYRKIKKNLVKQLALLITTDELERCADIKMYCIGIDTRIIFFQLLDLWTIIHRKI